MAKKVIKKETTPEVDQVKIIPAPEKPKQSIRETLALRGEKVIKDANKVITDLRELGTFAKNNNRPAKHFDIFAQQLEGFVNRISRMLH